MADAAKEMAILMDHVKDGYSFEFPFVGAVAIPQPFGELTKQEHDGHVKYVPKSGFLISRFMVLEVVVAVLLVAIFSRVAGLVARGAPPKGRFWNFFEVLLVYIRDQVAEPAIGKHDAHKFLPFLWTLFFFTLGCNLMGMVPWMGSATGAWAVTGVLAIITFSVVVGTGMAKMGPVGFWVGQVPHMELPPLFTYTVKPLIFMIEVLGMIIKHFVLSVRLLANMFAGHLVLAVIVGFIASAAKTSFWLWLGVTPASVFGATALSFLELIVAFLQAYILTFLSALFIGMAVHPH